MRTLDLPPSLASTSTIDDLKRLLQDLPRDSSDTTIQRNLSLVGMMAEPERMLRLLRQILDDETVLAGISGRSYRHVNHFDKIILVDSGDRQGYRLTLHLWAPPYTEDELDDELIHDHRFSFWSNILTGNLISQNFVRAEDGALFRQYRYVPQKRDVSTMENFYEFVGETVLRTIEPSNERAGQSYYLSYERIHRVVLPTTSMTCTLVLRGPRRREHSNVFNTAYPSADTRLSNVMFSPSQLAAKLVALSQEIERTRLRES